MGLLFIAIEPAHGIRTNGPRRNLRGLELLAFAVGLLDEHMSTFLDRASRVVCQAWPEHPMPFCFGTPLIIGVLPRVTE